MQTSPSSRQDTRSAINACAGSALALGAGLATSMSAMAGMVISPSVTVTNINITAKDDGEVQKIDLNGDGFFDISVAADKSWGSLKTHMGVWVLASKSALIRLSEGSSVGANSADGVNSEWLSSGSAYDIDNLGHWAEVGAHGYIGLRFDAAGGYRYGWLELTRGSLTAGQFGLQQAPGVSAAIPAATPPATAVPEPGSLLLVATGAAGLAALRRRRHQASAPAAAH